MMPLLHLTVPSLSSFHPPPLQTFVFDVRRPDLSYLSLYVYDEDTLSKEFLAFTSLPVTCVLPGLRTAYLYNSLGKREQDFQYASVFLRVAIEPKSV